MGCGDQAANFWQYYCAVCWHHYRENLVAPGTAKHDDGPIATVGTLHVSDGSAWMPPRRDYSAYGTRFWIPVDDHCPKCRRSRTGVCDDHAPVRAPFCGGGATTPLDDPGEHSSVWSLIVRAYEQEFN